MMPLNPLVTHDAPKGNPFGGYPHACLAEKPSKELKVNLEKPGYETPQVSSHPCWPEMTVGCREVVGCILWKELDITDTDNEVVQTLGIPLTIGFTYFSIACLVTTKNCWLLHLRKL